MKLDKELEGVLDLHSEGGTEGGYWAFQDSAYIGILKIENVIALDKEAMEEYRRTGKIKEKPNCIDDKHEEEVGDSWSYEGLHILQNNDRLTIYHPDDNKEVWSGVINLKQYNLFTEHALGMWIHADQIGIERDVWAEYFFKGYSAKLIPAKNYKQ